ncbi:MAG: 2-amino-4-hydroxy-6-hydroxymethyldihydropteridine diphosphokinase [Bacteroidetes bacterium]|nr:2-amino-4-hydroxy-6-hydroxymethyldihydropteridine diphosphokinase [Bacteroidota bacterium]
MKLQEAYILLGTNLGLKEEAIQTAKELLIRALGEPKMQSALYASKSWGFDGPDFLNQLLVFFTGLSPFEVLDIALDIEKAMGRIRLPGQGYTSRNIDIDLLYFGTTVMHHPRLTLPHPRLHLRRFVLMPLAELAPNMVHPRLGLTHNMLLARLDDQSPVWVHHNS